MTERPTRKRRSAIVYFILAGLLFGIYLRNPRHEAIRTIDELLLLLTGGLIATGIGAAVRQMSNRDQDNSSVK
jgi:heme A synthase